MSPFQDSDLDGFDTFFYQYNQKVIGESIIRFIQSIFDGISLVVSVNSTLVILIPKVDQPKSLNNFQQISLFNVSYKLITKLVASRLRNLLPELISPNRVSFMLGHHIQNNIFITQEFILTMSRIRGKKRFMAIKIDFEKTYDHFSQAFIVDTLEVVGIHQCLCIVILQCIHYFRVDFMK